MESGFLTQESRSPSKTLSSVFDEQCPNYMAMGMSYESFWDGDVDEAKFYRHAWKLKRKHEDESAWLMGLYIYNSLLSVYPAFNALANRNAKITPYPNMPITWEEERKAKEQAENFNKMMNLMNRINARFKGEDGK